jgi:hypothetical protein
MAGVGKGEPGVDYEEIAKDVLKEYLPLVVLLSQHRLKGEGLPLASASAKIRAVFRYPFGVDNLLCNSAPKRLWQPEVLKPALLAEYIDR